MMSTATITDDTPFHYVTISKFVMIVIKESIGQGRAGHGRVGCGNYLEVKSALVVATLYST